MVGSFLYVVTFFSAIFALDPPNNVCNNYTDYATLLINENCYYDPDVPSESPELAKNNGYTLEEYEVQTEDGHINTLFRIPGKRQPILLNHPYATSSDIWLLYRRRSLAIHLARRGYDVWLSNYRGTTFSQKHVKYNIFQREFWNFSFHEIGVYDIASNLEMVVKTTGRKPIYIGHSMGTTAGFVYAAERPRHAENHMKGMIVMAPVAYRKYVRSPIRVFDIFWRLMRAITEALVQGGMFKTDWTKNTMRLICSSYPAIKFCQFLLFLNSGFNYEQLKSDDMINILGHAFIGTSAKTLAHLLQRSVRHPEKFQKYHYDKITNMRIYGSEEPPEYDLKRIPVCVHLLYGKADYQAGPQDVEHLHENLKCSTINKIAPNERTNYNHNDFFSAKDNRRYLYPTVMKKIRHMQVIPFL